MMPSYLFKCSGCDELKKISCSVSEYQEVKESLSCEKCSKKMSRCFEKTFSFKIDKSSHQIVEEMLEQKQKLVDKFNQGDLKTITDICGD
jgi:hypothetical protein